MVTGMCMCKECGRWYFNWKKLYGHLVREHGYSTPLPEEPEEVECVEATGTD